MTGIDTTFLVQLEVIELPEHARARQLLGRQLLERSEMLLLAPQVLCEFVHIVTDPKRFQVPLSMDEAVSKANFRWNAEEITRVFPTPQSTSLFFDWVTRHRLGGKRLLDTQLAATLWHAGARSIISSNVRDFAIFGFTVISP